jgi:hypothetical protein
MAPYGSADQGMAEWSNNGDPMITRRGGYPVRYAARASKIPAMSRERGDRGDRMKRRQFITVIGRRASLDE